MRLRLILLATLLPLLRGPTPAWAQGHDVTRDEIAAGVVRDVKECKDRTPNTSVLTKTLGVGPITVAIKYDPADPERSKKEAALLGAVQAMLDVNYKLPLHLDVVFANDDSQAVVCHSFPSPMMVIGNQCNNVNPLHSATTTLEGGTGKYGHRGIADQAYDQVYAENKLPGVPARCQILAKGRARRARCTAAIVHELCHVAHAGQSEQEFWWSRLNALDGAGGWLGQCVNVSGYSCAGRVEYVAEVCTAEVLGKPLPPAVMTSYTALGGPRPGVDFSPVLPGL